jgi:hypothetical protein
MLVGPCSAAGVEEALQDRAQDGRVNDQVVQR